MFYDKKPTLWEVAKEAEYMSQNGYYSSEDSPELIRREQARTVIGWYLYFLLFDAYRNLTTPLVYNGGR